MDTGKNVVPSQIPFCFMTAALSFRLKEKVKKPSQSNNGCMYKIYRAWYSVLKNKKKLRGTEEKS